MSEIPIRHVNSLRDIGNELPVEGVGQISYWDCLPDSDKGFSFRLVFEEDDQEPGYGSIFRQVDARTRKQNDAAGYLLDTVKPFPYWLSQFMIDLQECTKAETAVLSYDRTTERCPNAPDLNHYRDNEAWISFSYPNPQYTSGNNLGIPIINHELFLGSAALQLESLYVSNP